MEGVAMVNPFDPKTVFLAKHAQHVVLVHFPIALFISAVAFDFIAQWTKRRGLADTAYYNLLAAAISTFPVPRHGYSRVAVPTRWAETEGPLVVAPGTRVRLKCDDLGGLVAALPRETTGGSL